MNGSIRMKNGKLLTEMKNWTAIKLNPIRISKSNSIETYDSSE